MEEEIEELLEKVRRPLVHAKGLLAKLIMRIQLGEAIDNLTGLLNSPDIPPSTSMMHAASRHRDVLDDYRRDFVRTRVSTTSAQGKPHDLTSMWSCNRKTSRLLWLERTC